jgi:hypothetical protein
MEHFVDREVHTVFGGGGLDGTHLRVLDVDDRIILKSIFKKYSEGLEWIDLDQNRDK